MMLLKKKKYLHLYRKKKETNPFWFQMIIQTQYYFHFIGEDIESYKG